MITLNSKIVIDCHRHMAKRFDFEIVQKADSVEMEAIGRGLDIMGIMDHERFMRQYAVSIVDPIFDRRLVYLPWTPGRGSQGTLIKQIDVIVHESKHIVDGDDPRFGPKYLLSKSYRAHAEVRALLHQMASHKALTDRVPNTTRLANGLASYRVRQRDIRVTKVELDVIASAIRRGAVPPGPAAVAIKYIKRRTRR